MREREREKNRLYKTYTTKTFEDGLKGVISTEQVSLRNQMTG